eukprot:3107260-Rhodomonas_salina.3
MGFEQPSVRWTSKVRNHHFWSPLGAQEVLNFRQWHSILGCNLQLSFPSGFMRENSGVGGLMIATLSPFVKTDRISDFDSVEIERKPW